MDPLTIILVALGTGATVGAQSKVKETYQNLKSLIQSRFAGQQSAEEALAEYEKAPNDWRNDWRTPLRKALARAHIDEDEVVVEAARKLLKEIEPDQTAEGNYNVPFRGTVQGYNQGTYQQVIMSVGKEVMRENSHG